MIDLIEKYLQFLMSNPDMLNSIILWTMVMTTVWIIMFRYRRKMIEGSSGNNSFWEMPEQVAYILNWVWPPVVCFSAFFKVELPSWVWWFMSSGVAYTVGGRWLFEWVLALRAGSTIVAETEKKTTTKTVEQKIEIKNSNEKEN